MFLSRKHLSALIASAAIVNAASIPRNATLPQKRDVCKSRADLALSVSKSMQDRHFTPKKCVTSAKDGTICSDGSWNNIEDWEAGPIIEDLLNVDEIGGYTDFENIKDTTTMLGEDTYRDQADDAGWGVLMFIRLVDHYGDKLGDLKDSYEKAGTDLFDFMSDHGDGDCGGGIWWDGKRGKDGYKNTISNALYMHTAAALFMRHGDDDYKNKALDTWKWLSGVKDLRTPEGLWGDGVHWNDGKCEIQTTLWSYTQGVMISGLGLLYKITGDGTYKDEAEKTLKGVQDKMTENGILKEVNGACDDVTQDANCNDDQQIFKGIFMKHVQYFLDQVDDDTRGTYGEWIYAQSSAVEHYATNSDNEPGNVWYSASQGKKINYSGKTADSGIAAHVAAAKYGKGQC